ncbi:hypothetical protein MJT46_018564 [Ovis ammon polii x Ovis aries]|nr:hypothetical protein MJT46_018561 [Ovis ammon polii x Ovis aries]KAI4550397.1 hypothetical protein MJT46_018562 [Ovis ammon polii x Ovis aries]KAI4550399.1 hypothetical protein MJT46_018564 [Ovis ammon polii x Ovis aries]
MGEESRKAPEELAWGLAFPGATIAGPCGPRRPSYRCCNSRSSLTYQSPLERKHEGPGHIEEPRFCLVTRDEVSFRCLVGKEFWAFPSHLKRRRSPQERREEVKRRATIPRVPLMSQSIPEDLFSLCCLYFQAEDRLRPRWHVGQLCTKSSCESLEGNPRGKATDPMIDAMASVTLLLQLGRKAHVHAPSREED